MLLYAGRGDEEALIPWADFLNHSSTSGSFLDYDTASRSVILRPSATVFQGAQVFASYGEKSNAELLLSYGFLLDANVHDCYRLTLTVPLRDPVSTRRPSSQPPASDQLVEESLEIPHAEAKLAALKRLGRGREATFPLRTSGTPEGLLPFAAFLAAGEKQGVSIADVDSLADLLLGRPGFAGEHAERLEKPEHSRHLSPFVAWKRHASLRRLFLNALLHTSQEMHLHCIFCGLLGWHPIAADDADIVLAFHGCLFYRLDALPCTSKA